jgi:hypothetical protein
MKVTPLDSVPDVHLTTDSPTPNMCVSLPHFHQSLASVAILEPRNDLKGSGGIVKKSGVNSIETESSRAGGVAQVIETESRQVFARDWGVKKRE